MGQKEVKINEYKIIQKEKVTHDTNRFRFAIPDGIDFQHLPGDFIKVYPDPGNPLEYRPYTPTSTPDIENYFELIIKHYSDGFVSKHMKEKGVGDTVHISGPHEGGHFTEGMAKKIGMVAGGTGITPMISIIRWILSHGYDVQIQLLFANKTVDDIILKDEFDGYAAKHDNFKRYYILENAPDGWDMGVGYITRELLNEKLFQPGDDSLVFLCGPPMMQINLKKYIVEMGYKAEKIIFP